MAQAVTLAQYAAWARSPSLRPRLLAFIASELPKRDACMIDVLQARGRGLIGLEECLHTLRSAAAQPQQGLPTAHQRTSAVLSLLNAQRETRLAPQHGQLLHWAQFVAIGVQTMLSRVDGAHAAQAHPTLTPATGCDAFQVARETADAVGAFAIEKFGSRPDMVTTLSPAYVASCAQRGVSPTHRLRVAGVASHLHFALSELLKNSVAACMATYTPAGVDDAPPITTSIHRASDFIYIVVSDAGGGFPAAQDDVTVRSSFPYFPHAAATASSQAGLEPSYHYSRDFGAAFTGYGVGLPRAAVYAEALGGSLTAVSIRGSGASMLLRVDATGYHALDWKPAPPET